jgi:hypothetical protein
MNEHHLHPQTGTRTYGHGTNEEEWPCLGAISIDDESLLVLWESTWYSPKQYHCLRENGHVGWLEYALLEDRLLIAWEPTIEPKSVQSLPGAILADFAIEVRRERPGLLGYVAAKYLNAASSSKRLAFLAYWKTMPMPEWSFLHLQGAYPSHRGHVVHSEGDKVWIQWEPTWVYYEHLDSKKKKLLYPLRDNPEALLARFHKAVVYYSTAVLVQKRLSGAGNIL